MAGGTQQQQQDEPVVPGMIGRSPPSFKAYSTNRLHQIAARVILEITSQDQQPEQHQPADDASASTQEDAKLKNVADEEDDGQAECGSDSDSDDDDDIEFTFMCRDPDTSEITADELFSDGQIRPTFPLFNRDLLSSSSAANDDGCASSSADNSASIMVPLRKLMISDNRSTSRPPHPPTSSDHGGKEHEDAPEDTYCVWTPRSPVVPPSPGQCKKSRSTGSSSRRWKLRDLLHRSSSDGKDTFVFLSSGAARAQGGVQAEGAKANSSSSAAGTKKKSSAAGMASAHEIHYVRNRAIKEGDRRRSFLPYRQGIVGFFSNP